MGPGKDVCQTFQSDFGGASDWSQTYLRRIGRANQYSLP
jgi:hypothetical protein